jgi:hypothetical protein
VGVGGYRDVVRIGLVLSVLVLSLLLAAPLSGAAESRPAAVSAKAKACKGGKVAVTVGKRTTCKPLGKAFPKPKAVDAKLLYATRALALNPARGAAGRAQRKLLRALPKVFATIDRAGKGKARSAALAQASAGCSAAVGGPSSVIAGVNVAISGENGAVLEVDSHGRRVKLRYGTCGRSNFPVPECPTAAGELDTSYTSAGEVVIEVWEGTSRLIERSRTSFESKAKAKAKVGPDAKLRYIDVEYTHEVFIVASGGVVERGKSERKVRIEMPGGKYATGGASVKVTGDASAVAKDGFEDVAKSAIDDFRRAEPRWSSFERKPHCAEPVFTPASNTLKLHKGQAGALGLAAKARPGGNATEARWTLLGPENATFSPLSSEQAAPSVSYTVTNAPEKGLVKVTVKFTSTAGVGEGTWVQPTEPSQLPTSYTGLVSGDAKYDADELGTGNTLSASWAGSVKLAGGPTGAPPGFPGVPAGLYSLSSGSVSYSFKGNVGKCDVAGAGSVDLTAGFGSSLPVLQLFDGEARSYRLEIPLPATELVKGTKSNCEDTSQNGEAFDWAVAVGLPWAVRAVPPGGPVAAEWSVAGNAAGNGGPGTPEQTWNWNLAAAGGS